MVQPGYVYGYTSSGVKVIMWSYTHESITLLPNIKAPRCQCSLAIWSIQIFLAAMFSWLLTITLVVEDDCCECAISKVRTQNVVKKGHREYQWGVARKNERPTAISRLLPVLQHILQNKYQLLWFMYCSVAWSLFCRGRCRTGEQPWFCQHNYLFCNFYGHTLMEIRFPKSD